MCDGIVVITYIHDVIPFAEGDTNGTGDGLHPGLLRSSPHIERLPVSATNERAHRYMHSEKGVSQGCQQHSSSLT